MAKIINGKWTNKKGELIHPDLVRVDEKLKDELVEDLITKAKDAQVKLKEFKTDAVESVESYYQLLLQEYDIDAKKNSKKGNLALENFSGTAKVEIRVADRIDFDEKLKIAKMKIDEYLNEITKNSNPEIKTLITKAFEVDKKGDVNAKKILALKSYDIQNPLWQEAMKIIDDATQVVSSKSYIRFYQREDTSKPYKQISLDISSL